MERLTKRNPLSGEIERLGLPQQLYKKLYKYEEAEEQGLLVRLPVPIGSDVYKICPQSNHLKMGDMWDGRIITTECQMCAWEMCDCYDIGYQQDRKNHIIRKMKANNSEWLIKIKPYFGIIYFATEAEALQALRKRGNEDEYKIFIERL